MEKSRERLFKRRGKGNRFRKRSLRRPRFGQRLYWRRHADYTGTRGIGAAFFEASKYAWLVTGAGVYGRSRARGQHYGRETACDEALWCDENFGQSTDDEAGNPWPDRPAAYCGTDGRGISTGAGRRLWQYQYGPDPWAAGGDEGRCGRDHSPSTGAWTRQPDGTFSCN